MWILPFHAGRALDLRIHVPGDVEEIREAVVVEVGQRGAPLHVAVLNVQTRRDSRILEQALAEIAIERRNVVGEMGLREIEPAVAVVVADSDAHPRLRAAVLAVGRSALDRDVGKRAVAIVSVEDGRRRIRRDVDVGPAVIGQIGADCGHRVTSGHARDARALGDVREPAVAVVVIEEVRISGQSLRSAIDGDSFPQTVRTGSGLGHTLEVELEIVGNEEIEPPVAIEIDERAARAPPHTCGR